MKRHALILTGMLSIAVPSVAAAQAPGESPFSDYRSAAQRQYGAQAPATATGAPTPVPPATTTTKAADRPGSGRAPGNGTGNGSNKDPASGMGDKPSDGSGNAPSRASGAAPVRVAPSTHTTVRKVKGGLPFTGADVTPLVLLALLLVSGGLFLRVAERRFRGRSAAH